MTLHFFVKKRLEETPEYRKLAPEILETLSNECFSIQKIYEQWKEDSRLYIPSSALPFKCWQKANEWIGKGVNGKNVYDYSGELKPIYPSEVEKLLTMKLEDVYTGEKEASFVSRCGWFYWDYAQSIISHCADRIHEYCPYPYYLDIEETQENEEAFSWELEQLCLLETFFDNVLFCDIVEESKE